MGELDAGAKKKLFAVLDKQKEVLKARKKAEDAKGAKRASKIKKGGGGGDDEKDNSRASRKVMYNFGSRKLQVLRPSEGYPTKKEAKRAVEGKLKLFYAHGYSGNFDESRQNIYLSQDGQFLIYYIQRLLWYLIMLRILNDFSPNTMM